MNTPHGFTLLPLADVIPTEDNPRVIRKDDPAFREFCANVKALGVLEPVLVRPHHARRRRADRQTPKVWRAIRAAVQARAGDKCEGCGIPNHALGQRDADGRWHPYGSQDEYDGPGRMLLIVCTTEERP